MKITNEHFDTSITTTRGILVLTVRGDYSLSKAMNLIKTAIDNAVSADLGKILIDINEVTGSVPFLDRFDFSSFLPQYEKEKSPGTLHQIALVGQEPIVHEDRFGELVAVNRGANLVVFTDRTEAFDWLHRK